MSKNMSGNYLRTFGYVLRRTNYGEADRILNVITPSGKISAIAKGVRREKSKLAGGVEMFSLVDLNIHRGKGEFGIITGARMTKFYGEILKDLNVMEVASSFLKKINKVADSSESEEYFSILGQSLVALNSKDNMKLVEAWFLLNLARAMGEEINLYRDNDDKKLEANARYDWDDIGACFMRKDNGEYGENEIKVLRLMTTNSFNIIKKIKLSDEIIDRVFELARRTCKI